MVSLTGNILKHCRDVCLAAKQYQEESARVRMRLSYLLSKVPEWSNRICSSKDDPGCVLLVQSLYNALTNLTTCIEALGTTDRTKWRTKIRAFLQGKDLLDELLRAESVLDHALLEVNVDNTSFLASHIERLHEMFLNASDSSMEEKVSLMISASKKFDDAPAGNLYNPNETLEEIIESALEDCYEDEADEGEEIGKGGNATTEKTSDSCEAESYSEIVSLLIDPTEIQFEEKRIGVGGFAKVFQGKYKGEEVAIKVIDIYRNFDSIESMTDEIFQAECRRVYDEVLIIKECSIHSNVLDVFGYCKPDHKGSKPMIIMELMHCSLSRILHEERNSVLSFCASLQLMKNIASAIEFLHLQRYVHQDIKPSNILVDSSFTVAKLADFGVAERKGFDTTWTNRQRTVLATTKANGCKKFTGTKAYQAPEIVLGNVKEISRGAEIYSFGVTLWECITRKIPHYKKEDQIIVLAKHSTKLMLHFPVKDFLDDKTLLSIEEAAFLLMEKIAYLCLSKFPHGRPTATQLTQYFEGSRQFNPDFLMLAPLSKWYNKSSDYNTDVDDGIISLKDEVNAYDIPHNTISSITELERCPVVVDDKQTMVPFGNDESYLKVIPSAVQTEGKINLLKNKWWIGVCVIILIIIIVVIVIAVITTGEEKNPEGMSDGLLSSESRNQKYEIFGIFHSNCCSVSPIVQIFGG